MSLSDFLTLSPCLNLWCFLSTFDRLHGDSSEFYQRTTGELKLAGIALKRSKMLRKRYKFRQGDEVRNSDVFLLPLLTPK